MAEPTFEFSDASIERYGKQSETSSAIVGNGFAAVEDQAIGTSMKTRVRKAVFPVAGMGTRFLPATKAIPKEMLPIVDKPVVQYAVEEAREAGIEQFVFITGRGKHVIADHFDHAYELESLLEERHKTAELHSL